MNPVKKFPKFVRKLFYEHDISALNLNISPTNKMILMAIAEHKDKCMSEISKEVGLEKSSFTRSVDHLINNGFIQKKYSKTDRRIIHILFTAKGLKALKLIREDWEKYFESLISVLSSSEKQEFFSAIKIVSKYINQIT